MRTAVDRWGRLDVLVNNAAVFSTITMKPFDQIPLAEWEQVLRVNLTGTFVCCTAVAPVMRAQHWGRIINLSSSTVLMGRPDYAHYVASKAGVVGLTRALARELGGDGITVNAIMPGSTETEVPRETVSPEQAGASYRRPVAAPAHPGPRHPRHRRVPRLRGRRLHHRAEHRGRRGPELRMTATQQTASLTDLAGEVALACRILARAGLASGSLGHVSARSGPARFVVRCRSATDTGLLFTAPDDVRETSLDDPGARPGLLRCRTSCRSTPSSTAAAPRSAAIVHVHAPAAVLCGLAGLELRPVFGSYDIPAARLALAGVPLFGRAALITRAELADELIDAMGPADVCLMRGHGITVTGISVDAGHRARPEPRAACPRHRRPRPARRRPRRPDRGRPRRAARPGRRTSTKVSSGAITRQIDRRARR